MTRIEALKELERKVSDGTLHEDRHGGMPVATRCYPRDNVGPYDTNLWHDSNAMIAYHGGLSAAKKTA